ncbi:MAG: 50S ribosomal protein P1 [Candidatus Marsarchaeota archaeon]|jgi:large subunit ribosomal protein L12|nr:50S ribosomal protein P1 [Candidatus Marsarchaeota archaeon]
MEYVYAALLLEEAGKEISEKNLVDVVKAAGFSPDEAKARAIAESLKDVNIKDVIKNAQSFAAAPQAAAHAPAAEAAKPKEKAHEDDSKKEEEAAGGLASLFG